MKRTARPSREARGEAIAMVCAAVIAISGCASGDATRQVPCVAPIAGVCAPPAPSVKPDRAIGGGPVEPVVVAPAGPDAGVAMPQFEYAADGSVRVGP